MLKKISKLKQILFFRFLDDSDLSLWEIVNQDSKMETMIEINLPNKIVLIAIGLDSNIYLSESYNAILDSYNISCPIVNLDDKDFNKKDEIFNNVLKEQLLGKATEFSFLGNYHPLNDFVNTNYLVFLAYPFSLENMQKLSTDRYKVHSYSFQALMEAIALGTISDANTIIAFSKYYFKLLTKK